MTQLTILNEYRLEPPAAQFIQAIRALSERVEREGEPGVRSYRFFVNETEGSARAVIEYATPQAWIGHHDRSMAWPEMKQLHQVARLDQVTFLGPLTPEIQSWLEKSGLRAKVNSGYTVAAGFSRP